MTNESKLLLCLVLAAAIGVVYVVKYEARQQPPQVANGNISLLPPWEPRPPQEFTLDQALTSINEAELKQNLYYLASPELEGRMSGKTGNRTAAEMIKRSFEACGLKATYQKFAIERMNPGPKNETGDNFTQNIVAWKEGTTLPNEIVVIGAHMDHIGYGPQMSRSRAKDQIHPGADDNASGTVALIEMAQAISGLQPKRTVVFIAFSAEEMGLIGSRYYCANPLFPVGNPNIKNHIFMLNMDMIGYLGKGQFDVFWATSGSSVDVNRYIQELNGKYSFAENITSRGTGGSDHASFYNKKVPIAFLHTGLHPHYHTPTDTPDRINYSGIEQVSRYGFELAWKVIQSDAAPVFNLATFKEMPYTHDHGHPEMPFHSYHHHHN